MGKAALPDVFAEEAFGEGAEFGFGEELLDGGVVAFFGGVEEEVVEGGGEGGVGDDGGEVFGEEGFGFVGFDFFLLFAFELAGVF